MHMTEVTGHKFNMNQILNKDKSFSFSLLELGLCV